MMEDHARNAERAAALNEDGRLLILQILSEETTQSLTDYLIEQQMRRRWIARPRSWLRTQLRTLETLGALTIVTAGSDWIARLTQAGKDHVDRVAKLEGVRWPPLEV